MFDKCNYGYNLMKSITTSAGGVFAKTEMSEVLTEIIKMDPNFDKEQFILDCKHDIIPNVLEVSTNLYFNQSQYWVYGL